MGDRLVSRLGLIALGGVLTSVLGAMLWPFGERPRTLTLPGTVEVQEVRLGPRVAGRVERVAVAEGEVVEPGRPLLYLEVPELRAQLDGARAALAAAEAARDRVVHGPRAEEIAAARAEAEAAKSRWERLKAGARREEIDRARSELASAEADLRVTQEEGARVSDLVRRGVSTESEYREMVGVRERLEGRVRAARAALALLLAGSRPEEIAEAAAEHQAAVSRRDLLIAGSRPEDVAEAKAKADQARAAVRELEARVAEAVVVAPERAVVEVVGVRRGDLVAAGQPVVRILRAEDLWVKVYAPETELGKLRRGQAVTVRTDSYPGTAFRGEVVQIAAISEFTPRNVQSADERRHQVFAVKVRVADPRGVFKSGMAADVVLPLHDAAAPAAPPSPGLAAQGPAR
jgi:multidrug resistance efflux pump